MDTTLKTSNTPVVTWKPTCWVSGYGFSNPKNMGPLTKSFMKYVRSCEAYKQKATKRGFYKLMNREHRPGHNSTFFAAIKDAGIVTLNKKWNGSYNETWYIKGPNWNNYLNGNLRRK